MSTQVPTKKRAVRLVLLTLVVVALGFGAYKAYQAFVQPLFKGKASTPVEDWKVTTGVTLKPAALATGETLLVLLDGASYQIALIDPAGKQVWKETLPADTAGAEPNSRGLLVYAPLSVRYYETRGLVWQWKADATVLAAFPMQDGAAIISTRSGNLESDPRAVPFSERILYIDQKGKKAWEKPPVDRALLWAGSSTDGELLVTTSLALDNGTEACVNTYRRNGSAVSEVRGEGSAFSSARLSPTGDLLVVGLVGRLTGATASGKWYYQLPGEPRSLAMGSRKESICLVKPRAKYAVLELFMSPRLVAVSAQGASMWDTRLASTSRAAWTDVGSSLTIVASKDGLVGFDSAGNKVWQLQTQADVRAVAFYPDGSFLSVSGSGAVIHYRR